MSRTLPLTSGLAKWTLVQWAGHYPREGAWCDVGYSLSAPGQNSLYLRDITQPDCVVRARACCGDSRGNEARTRRDSDRSVPALHLEALLEDLGDLVGDLLGPDSDGGVNADSAATTSARVGLPSEIRPTIG